MARKIVVEAKHVGRGSGGITNKGFKPGQSGSRGVSRGRALMTSMMTVAMTRQMGAPIPSEPDRSFAARIGSNAVIVLDQQLELCRKYKTFNRDIIPLMQFVAERLEGRVPMTVNITRGVEARPDEELLFYTFHKHFPEEHCSCSDAVKKECPKLGTVITVQ